MGADNSEGVTAWLLQRSGAAESEDDARVWGLTAAERLRRSLLRQGVARIERLPADGQAELAQGPCVVLREDLFYDERVLAGLLDAKHVVLVHSLDGDPAGPISATCDGSQLAEVVSALCAGELPAGLQPVGLLDLAPAYDQVLRKQQEPFVYPTWSTHLREVEDRIFDASYKGITDLVTKWVFPLPAREVVRVLARMHVRPNTVTSVSYVLAVAVTWLFWEGWFGTGLALGWLMTFLDTVDGKLARCTLTSTPFGNIFDHGLDLVHPPFWWAAWAVGLPGSPADHTVALAVVLGGYVVGRLLEGVFLWSFKIQFFIWQPFDGVFRQVIARRNPNMLLLTAGLLVGRPDWGFTAVAVWTAVCVGITAMRNLQAGLISMRGGKIRSWLDEARQSA